MRRAALRTKKMHKNITRASSEINTKSESDKLKKQPQRTGFCLLGRCWAISIACYQKQLATKISEKSGQPYADTKSYIQTKISFALLRNCVLCLRGCSALKPRVPSEISISVVVEEGSIAAARAQYLLSLVIERGTCSKY